MSVESSIRYGNEGPHRNIFNHGGNAQHYGTPDPFLRRPGVRWRWLDLWEQENPNPGGGPDFEEWRAENEKVHDRCWVAWCLPDFNVWDWSEEDVATARKLVSGHVCGVCGRADDPGCTEGC